MITFLYQNKLKDVVSITESELDGGGSWGTAYIADDDINSAFRGDLHYTNPGVGTTTITFSFGSAIYIDSIIAITNLTTTGTMWLMGGTIASTGNFITGVPIDGLGTSHKYFENQGYQYWKFNMKGATAISQHQLNELFLGRRTLIEEMPSYPFITGVEENTIDLVSERGQKWVYQNYDREYWIMNWEGVTAVTENALHKMYKYCRKNTQPLWMSLNADADPLDIKFVRFRDGAFLSSEETKNVYDLTVEFESEK